MIYAVYVVSLLLLPIPISICTPSSHPLYYSLQNSLYIFLIFQPLQNKFFSSSLSQLKVDSSLRTLLSSCSFPHTLRCLGWGVSIENCFCPLMLLSLFLSLLDIHCFKVYAVWLYASYSCSLLLLIPFLVKPPSCFKDVSIKLHFRPIHHLGFLISLDLFYFGSFHLPATSTSQTSHRSDCHHQGLFHC